jgi:hypothetical protein
MDNNRSSYVANLDLQANAAARRAFRYTPPVPTRKLSWLSCLILALCGH